MARVGGLDRAMTPVMYHYVRPAAPGLPRFPYLALADFERQLDHFGKTFGFVGRAGFEAWVAGGPAPEGVLLTFDDGLRDHAEFVLPVLRRRGLFGLFYVPSGPIRTGGILDVHKVHLALGRIGGEAALHWLLERHPELEPDLARSGAGHYAAQSSDEATKRIKRLFNWQLDAAARQPALDGLLTFAFDGAPPHWSTFYLDDDGVGALVAAGMGVGAHGHAHAVLSRLTEAEQRREIEVSCELIRSLVGSLDWGYCYAYGAFDTTAERIVEEAGCPFAFAVDGCDVEMRLNEISRYALPRHNCNAFPHGAVSFWDGASAP